MSRGFKIIVGVLAAVAVLALCLIVAFVLLRPRGEEPPPTDVAATVVPPTTSPEPGVDDSWDRVQAAGKMVVGTAADYPPYEYYVGDLRIDGFDIALMDEISRRLGVQVEYRDFAFDGLSGALQLGQIDAAIAAISITPEREAFADFSNVYFVGEDGIVARGDSSIDSISSATDMAQYKVGVQRASVYEGWLQQALVDTGQMPSGNLLAYEKAGDAIRDLNEGRVDLVMLDAEPAEVAVNESGVKLVGKGLNQQRLAIALPKGALSLKAELDRVLTDLHNEGVISQLAKQYLNIDQLLPTPTPTPPPAATNTPPPPPSCVDGMTFVQHLTEGGQKQPGESFVKGWRVKNTGTCTWDTNYRLAYVSGARMGGEPVPVTRQVPPGDTYDFQVKLVAPLQPGSYQGIWQMYNAQNRSFGERLKVSVQVVGGPTPTPAPTQTPTAGIIFTVDRDRIKHGECVNFYWKVDNVKAIYFYPKGSDWRDHGVTGEETRRECPPVTMTYYLRVVKLNDQVVEPNITIYVEGAPDAPYIKRFTVDPQGQIVAGQCVNIKWNVEGVVDKITLWYNNTVLWDGAPVKGEYQHCPPGTGLASYSLEAVGPGGTSRAQQNVNVVDPSTATPVPTAAPEAPVIYGFSVSPNQIQPGQCVDINWSAGGGAAYVKLSRNGDTLVDDGPLTGHEFDCLSEAGTYTYRLEAYNAAGAQVNQQQTVNVVSGGPDNPLVNTFWVATIINGDPVLAGTSVTAGFDADGRVSGSTGCNTYSASYTVSGSSISISSASLTGVLCEDAVVAQEQAFLDALASATSFTLEAGQLYLQNAGGIVEFVAAGP